MKRIVVILHAIAVLAALAICLSLASNSLAYWGREPFAYTYERSTVALLCGSFAASHLYLVVTKRLTKLATILFYPLCLLVGSVTAVVTRSSAKDWAPATAEWATYANVVGYGIVFLLIFACVVSVYLSIITRKP